MAAKPNYLLLLRGHQEVVLHRHRDGAAGEQVRVCEEHARGRGRAEQLRGQLRPMCRWRES
jgi:hypothetical protein